MRRYCFILLLLIPSCDGAEPLTEYGVTIRTDKVRYHGAPLITGSYTIENTGGKTVYYVCGGCDGIEEWIGGELTTYVWSRGCLECLAIDPLHPGKQITYEFRFTDSDSGAYPAPDFSSRALYRVAVQLYKTKNLHELLDEDELSSNWFEMLP